MVTRGHPLPDRSDADPSGINFVLICRHGTAVWLVLSEPCDGEIHAEIPLDPVANRTGDHWHVRVEACPRSSVTVTGSTGPGTTAIVTIRTSSYRSAHARRFPAAVRGTRGAACPGGA